MSPIMPGKLQPCYCMEPAALDSLIRKLRDSCSTGCARIAAKVGESQRGCTQQKTGLGAFALGDREPRTIPTKDLPHRVVFFGGGGVRIVGT